MFEKVSRSLKYDSKKKFLYIFVPHPVICNLRDCEKCGLWSHNPHFLIQRAQTCDITHARDSAHEQCGTSQIYYSNGWVTRFTRVTRVSLGFASGIHAHSWIMGA